MVDSSSSSSPRLRVITGKGGVGKTVIATALALAEARRGKRVLLAELNGGERITPLLGCKAVGPVLREVEENLFVVDMQPHEAMREYAMLVLRFQAVYNVVFENPLVRSFVRMVPSLGELVLLGKTWYHEQQMVDDHPRFDVIVVDAPATGHAISLLRTPHVVSRAVPPGTMRKHAGRIDDMLRDPERTVMHIVTTPEEMPVNEAVELERAACDVLRMRVGTTFINQRVVALPAVLRDPVEALAAAPASPLQHLGERLLLREQRIAAGESHLSRLPARMLQDSVSVPRLISETFGRDAIEQLAGVMSAWLAATSEEPRR